MSIMDKVTRAEQRLVWRLGDQAFPHATCPASRHVALIADALAAGKKYPMLDEDPGHCAGSLYATVAALWEARMELAKLKAERIDHA